ncbi:MAG: hypothetical protein A2Y17_02515 [Clostridiales bacterium GWF2_38_85]|nr:MAG: hypothetical protein A2Y17_02515 [Clostridiales bacterium GWF2_38_85]HBL85071.1 hypothetical protein [Clostridiales bacterium]
MNNDKKRILQMVSEGKISTDEALTLLEALGEPEGEKIEIKDRRGRKKNLRVDIDAGDNSGKAKVKVNVPLSIIKALMPLAKSGVIPEKTKHELERQGINLDQIIKMTESVTDELADSDEEIVNITAGDGEDGATVKVYVD